MKKRDLAVSTLVSTGVALTTTVVASQLDIKLSDSESKPSQDTQPIKPDHPPRVYETVGGPKQWDHMYDVVVVGSGAAGLMAGISALWTKPDATVLVVESEETVGGTTAKSGGVFWLPNNVKMTVPDSKEQTVHVLARLGYPDVFDESKEFLGLDEDDYSRLCQFYELGRPLSAQLQEISYCLNRARDGEGRFLFDYTYSPRTQPDNVAPQQRHLGVGMPPIQRYVMKAMTSTVGLLIPVLRKIQQAFPAVRELSTLGTFSLTLTYGFGANLVDVLQREFTKGGNGRIQLNSLVDGVILDDGSVVGVRVLNTKTGKHEFIGARRGVVFASGGYSQDRDLVQTRLIQQQRFVHRTGASKGNTGVFAHLADKLGAKTEKEDLSRIWGCEAVLDESTPWESPTCMFQMRGDSFFVVGPNGKRVYNEKGKYDLRARAHWSLPKDSCADPEKGVFFMVGDARCQHIFGGELLANSWLRDPNDPRYIKGNTITELADQICKRYPQYVVGDNETFRTNLKATLIRFNGFARKGVDEDFGRGTNCPSDQQWTSTGIPGENIKVTPNRAMFPLDESGPFLALPIVASIIDTKGGPKVDSQCRVIAEQDGLPIDRLYAAGNCARSLTGDAYMSGGLTLGPALVSGYVAGMNAVLRGSGGAKL